MTVLDLLWSSSPLWCYLVWLFDFLFLSNIRFSWLVSWDLLPPSFSVWSFDELIIDDVVKLLIAPWPDVLLELFGSRSPIGCWFYPPILVPFLSLNFFTIWTYCCPSWTGIFKSSSLFVALCVLLFPCIATERLGSTGFDWPSLLVILPFWGSKLEPLIPASFESLPVTDPLSS